MNDYTLTNATLPAAIGYVLAALAAPDSCDHAAAEEQPADTVLVAERGVALTATADPEPAFRDAILTFAAEQRIDVVLVRVVGADDDYIRASVDLALGLLPGARPWSMSDLEPWAASDGQVWLVPEGFGPAVSIGEDGITLEMVPPYSTAAQRTAGILRAAGEIAALLPVLVVEPR